MLGGNRPNSDCKSISIYADDSIKSIIYPYQIIRLSLEDLILQIQKALVPDHQHKIPYYRTMASPQ
eukprot:gene16408-19730_t